MTLEYDPVAEARFRATVEAERRWSREQITLLWQHMGKRRQEMRDVDVRLTGEITGIRKTINGAILWFAVAAGGVIFSIFRAKLGF